MINIWVKQLVYKLICLNLQKHHTELNFNWKTDLQEKISYFDVYIHKITLS